MVTCWTSIPEKGKKRAAERDHLTLQVGEDPLLEPTLPPTAAETPEAHFTPSERRGGFRFSGATSGADVGGDEDLLLPVAEALDDIGPLGYCQLRRQDGHLMPILAHLH